MFLPAGLLSCPTPCQKESWSLNQCWVKGPKGGGGQLVNILLKTWNPAAIIMSLCSIVQMKYISILIDIPWDLAGMTAGRLMCVRTF